MFWRKCLVYGTSVKVEVWIYIAGCGFSLKEEMPHNALAANSTT